MDRKAKDVFPAKKKRGRPKGSKNKRGTVQVDTVAPRCPKCGSSERGSYFGSVRSIRASGYFQEKEFNRITIRRTRCKCGQIRIERSFELVEESR